jgi:serine kinase of HPr protein (carbohydrate metabolism regulator)
MKLNLHASCVALGGKAVLLLGPSGAGKSDLALRLIDEGAKLVADDRTDLVLEKGRWRASAPATIAGLIEVRGLGIIRLPVLKRAPVVLAVRLAGHVPRLPEPDFFAPGGKKGAKIPQIALNPVEASTPAKIRLALRHCQRK